MSGTVSTRSTRELTVLMTGFAPFGSEASNPSWEAARAREGGFSAEISQTPGTYV